MEGEKVDDGTGGKRPPRVVVVESEGHDAEVLPWIPVGIHRWVADGAMLAVIVKVTFTWSGAKSDATGEIPARLAPEQEPLVGDVPSPHPGAQNELYQASDWVPRKAAADVLLVGQAHALRPSATIEGHLRAAGVRRPFVVAAGAPATAIPLTLGYLQAPPPVPHGPVGPARTPGNPSPWYARDFDFSAHNAAIVEQRAPRLGPGEAIDMAGLAPDGARRVVRLPALCPVVGADVALYGEQEIPMTSDTLWIDPDREIAVQVWRGSLAADEEGRDIDRVIVSLEHADAIRPPTERLPSFMRGKIGFVLREGEPPAHVAAQSERETEILTMARYGTWSAEAPEPRMPLEQYVTVSAELAEWPDRRAETLARHGLEDEAFTIEERAWLEAMGNQALDGDARLAERYGTLYVAAQDALATRAEIDQKVEAYAEIAAAIEVAEDPNIVLGEHKLSLSQWLRMERRWNARAQLDPELAERIERLIAAARPVTPESAPPAEGDDG